MLTENTSNKLCHVCSEKMQNIEKRRDDLTWVNTTRVCENRRCCKYTNINKVKSWRKVK